MKRIILISMLAVLLGCSCDDEPTAPDSYPRVGTWCGMAVTTYPGPADEPLTDSGTVVFVFFENSKYLFYKPGEQEPLVQAEGIYEAKDDTVRLSQTSPTVYGWVYTLSGPFRWRLVHDTLSLNQVLHSDLWPVTHQLRLMLDYQKVD
jgi:hypothetical protein